MTQSVLRRVPGRRWLAVFLAAAALATTLGVNDAQAESVCHTGTPVYYGNNHFGFNKGCKYEEHAVYWTCGAKDPETGNCWKYNVREARWRGETYRCFGSGVTKWRLMYARLIRIRDGAVIWSIGWQPYSTNCTHLHPTYFPAVINKAITEPHAVTFKFEFVGDGINTLTFNLWGRINLYPGA